MRAHDGDWACRGCGRRFDQVRVRDDAYPDGLECFACGGALRLRDGWAIRREGGHYRVVAPTRRGTPGPG